MKVKVENDRLVIYEADDYMIKIFIDVNAEELAKALKPYLDSIDNCEVKK